jgi:hypothetical protein
MVFFLIVMFLPWIPGLRDLPDYLRLYKIFWNRYTIPEMRGPGRRRASDLLGLFSSESSRFSPMESL